MLGRYSRSQPFFCLFIQNGCEGRSKDKERQKPIKPGEGHGQTTFVVWSIWFLVRVVEKGGFCQERKVSIWKEMQGRIMEWHGNYPSSPGICGAFVFFFSEPLQLLYGRGKITAKITARNLLNLLTGRSKDPWCKNCLLAMKIPKFRKLCFWQYRL